MIVELLIMNGYGQFVWPAFFLTALSLSYLIIKKKVKIKKQEKMFLIEFKNLNNKKIKLVKSKVITKEVLSVN